MRIHTRGGWLGSVGADFGALEHYTSPLALLLKIRAEAKNSVKVFSGGVKFFEMASVLFWGGPNNSVKEFFAPPRRCIQR